MTKDDYGRVGKRQAAMSTRRRRERLLPPSQEPSSPRSVLTRFRKNVRLPSVEDLAEVHLAQTSFCDPLELHDMIVNVQANTVKECSQWRAIQLRCQTHHDEAGRLDRRGRTCLHAACAKKPPSAVVSAIIAACGPQTVCLERDNHGRTPLAIAISSNASLMVIERLLEANKQAARVGDRLGQLPIHQACGGYDHGKVQLVRLLLQSYSNGAKHESINGRTPLHSAVEGGAPVEVIQLLVAAFPEAVVMDGCGMNPLFMAIQQNAPLEVIQALVHAKPTATRSRDRGGGLPLRRAIEIKSPTAILKCLCTSPEVVTDADLHMKNTALHSAFDCGFPRESMVRLLVTTAPHVSTQECRSGHTPLTLACQKYARIIDLDYHPQQIHMLKILSMLLRAWTYSHLNREGIAALIQGDEFIVHAAVSTILPKNIVLTTIQSYPNQAAVPDSFGHYPLYLALTGPYQETKRDILLQLMKQHPNATSLYSHDKRSMLSVAASSRTVAPDVVEELVKAHPAALRQLDPLFGLYPFQVAALEKEDYKESQHLHPRIQKEWDQKVDEDLYQVSVIFQLLLAAPELVLVRV